MKNSVFRTTLFIGSLFVFLMACQAQNETELDSLYEAMAADPLTHDHKAYALQLRNMIQFKYVDLESTHALYDRVGVESYCDIHEDVSHIKGAREYMDLRCLKRNVYTELREKYPDMVKLTSEQRKSLLYPGAGLSKAEMLEILDNRRPKDTSMPVPD